MKLPHILGIAALACGLGFFCGVLYAQDAESQRLLTEHRNAKREAHTACNAAWEDSMTRLGIPLKERQMIYRHAEFIGSVSGGGLRSE
jgi:hypothetical protein